MVESMYAKVGLYDEILPPYIFDGQSDEELLATELAALDRRGAAGTKALELGCGTGRMTTVLRRHAPRLICIDNSEAMLTVFRQRHPDLHVKCIDARTHVSDSIETFDLVTAFWSLNYPLLSCFESHNGTEIRQLDPDEGLHNARAFLRALLERVGPAGNLLVFFFDDESPEQQLVTRLWERIAPFPGTGRGFTRILLLDYLMNLQDQGEGSVTHRHLLGHAHADSLRSARRFVLEGHLRSFPGLADHPDVLNEVDQFLNKYRNSNGTVDIPAGLHIVRFARNCR
jgi:SAM-dependent methyltransferase